MLTDKTVVLDLDDTLIRTVSEEYINYFKNFIPNLYDRIHKLSKSYNGYIICRQYYKDFLKFCFYYFVDVVVWSAASKLYVEEVVAKLFDGLPKPSMVLTGDNVVSYDGLILKPISKYNLDLTKTLVIDDNVSTANFNRDNIIAIPEFSAGIGTGIHWAFERPPALLKIMNWLTLPEVVNSTDVRSLDKSNIFK